MAYIGNKPANKPVVASDLDPTVITGQTALATSPADTDEFLISDAGVLKRLDASLIGGANTPAFAATYSGTQTLNNNTTTKIEFTNELYDSGSVYDTSNSRFTPGVAGQYNIKSSLWLQDDQEVLHFVYYMVYKNGSQIMQTQNELTGGVNYRKLPCMLDVIIESDADDYFEIYLNGATGDSGTFTVAGSGSTTSHRNMFSAFKIIT